ncbi:DUF4062 domain-containing protein [Vibrio vulnificus]|uniref:DUF4062 domain-containing protein n=1 Tax=Vibrio vulnificus TaxID=672 RepID=UPI001A19EA34|nr:DUF4062 domain-containing protein [Vibrio vulnificus]MDS1846553.1 DUF4062 domain-containing protein [Vibrio vulnificus]HAS8286881.1 DUF4062 domain-containing protein [Vibrio vulnificus]
MAVPKVFVSSTCYDLAEERAQLERFITSYGFQPILSEFSDVFYDPDEHTHEACVKEVAHCDLFVLIISGRFGGKYISGTGESITQAEYNEARKLNIPIFAFVKSDVLQAQLYYKENLKNESKEFADKIYYPAINKQSEAVSIFSFIQSVQHAKENNAIESYSSFGDVENHLRKQWAGLFHNFLQKRKQQFDVEHISTVLDKLSDSSAKLESLVESLHSSNQGEEKTQELITQAKVKQSIDSFFQNLKEHLEDLLSWGKASSFSKSDILKASQCDPKKFNDYIGYLNGMNLGDIKVYEDEGGEAVTFLRENMGIGFGYDKESTTHKVFTDMFNSGIKLSNGTQRKEYLTKHLSKWMK